MYSYFYLYIYVFKYTYKYKVRARLKIFENNPRRKQRTQIHATGGSLPERGDMPSKSFQNAEASARDLKIPARWGEAARNCVSLAVSTGARPPSEGWSAPLAGNSASVILLLVFLLYFPPFNLGFLAGVGGEIGKAQETVDWFKSKGSERGKKRSVRE